MTAKDRIQFVSEMMPKCLNTIFSEIEPEAKQNLAREMIGKIASIFEEQLKNDNK